MSDPKTADRPKTFEEVAKALGDFFAPELVKFRADAKPGQDGTARVVAYIDARTVFRRLNGVLGVNNWRTRLTFLPSGGCLCRLSVRFPGTNEWIPREDVGSPSEQPDEGDRTKAAASDSIKRAAVQFGIGEYLYRMPKNTRAKVDGRGVIQEKPEIPQEFLPESYRYCGANIAGKFAKLAATALSEGVPNVPAVVDLAGKYGYGKDYPLARIQKRHMTKMIQDVNDAINEAAKRKTAAQVATPEPAGV